MFPPSDVAHGYRNHSSKTPNQATKMLKETSAGIDDAGAHMGDVLPHPDTLIVKQAT
jgi:hypothetical protein